MSPSAPEPPRVDPASAVHLARRLNGMVETQLLFLAAHLRIPDLLENGALSVADLASQTRTNPDRLARVMRALEAIGIVIRFDSPDSFALAPLGRPLLSNAPDSLRSLAIYSGSPWRVYSWTHMLDSLQSNRSAAREALGSGLFDYLAEHPADADNFNNAMLDTSRRFALPICDAWDFSASSVIVDIGSGSGGLVAEILRRHHSTRAILADRPDVLRSARAFLATQGVDAHCEFVNCDFRNGIPAGGDTYVLQRVLHDWEDDRVRNILGSVRRVLPVDGTLLIVDMVLPQRRVSLEAAYTDLEMLVLTDGGRERTESEFEHLIQSSGLRLLRTIPTRSPLSVLECVSPQRA